MILKRFSVIYNILNVGDYWIWLEHQKFERYEKEVLD